MKRTVLDALKRIWSIGAAGQPPGRARQIGMANLVGVVGILTTWHYQIYYLVAGVGDYLPLFLLNLVFTVGYLSMLALNGAHRFDAASATALATPYIQFFVVTALISTGAGVHLFYFTVGGVLALLISDRHSPLVLGLVALGGALYLFCHFVFPPGSTPLTVPETAMRVMYVGSAIGAVTVTGAFSYLFRIAIERAEVELKRSNLELERLSAVDALTGLANRRALDSYLAQESTRMRRSRQPLSVILLDVDCFKAYNDQHGHLAGDHSLQCVAGAVRASARRTSDLAARYGGEEFVLVLPDTDEDGATRIAEEVRIAVAALGIPHDRSYVADVVTVSAGVATASPYSLDGPSDLLRRADSALYAAKDAGRNRVVVQFAVDTPR